MTLPSISLSLIDPGAITTPVGNAQVPIYAGVANAGDLYTVKEFTRRSQIVAEYEYGHLVDVLCAALAAGAPSVKACRVAMTDAYVIDVASDQDLLITSITGEPLNFASVRIVAAEGTSGAVSAGAVKVRYSLDAWDIPFTEPSYSDVVTVPANGHVELSGLGLTVVLDTAQTPVAGEAVVFDAQPGHYTSTEVALLADVLRSPLAGVFTYLVLCGAPPAASDGNTIAQALDTLISTLFAEGRFFGALADAGTDTASAVVTAVASTAVDPPFVSLGYGASYTTNPTSEVGRGRVALREHESAAIRISRSLISTDPGRTASGALNAVIGTDYDAALEGSTLHDARISVLRTWEPMAHGVYVARQRLLSQVNSNFKSWPHVAVMLVALNAANRIAFRLVLDVLRKQAAGTIDPRDAADIKIAVEKEMSAALLTEQNARGEYGHVSALSATVDRTTLLPRVAIDIRIRPLDYAEDLILTLQYAAEV